MKIRLRNLIWNKQSCHFLRKFQFIFFKHLRLFLNLKNSCSAIPLIFFQYGTICLPAFILRTRSTLQEAWRLSIERIPRVQLQLEAHYLLQATSNQAHKYLNHLCLSHIYLFSPLLSALVTKETFCKSKFNFLWSLFNVCQQLFSGSWVWLQKHLSDT